MTGHRNVVRENFFRDFGDHDYQSDQLQTDLDTYKCLK
eukprot:UN22074